MGAPAGLKKEAEEEEEEGEEEEEEEEEDEEDAVDDAGDDAGGEVVAREEAAEEDKTAEAILKGTPGCPPAQSTVAHQVVEFEVQGCSARCTFPCMDGCTWTKCIVMGREEKHCTVKMEDGEEIRVLNRYVRPVTDRSTDNDQGRELRRPTKRLRGSAN